MGPGAPPIETALRWLSTGSNLSVQAGRLGWTGRIFTNLLFWLHLIGLGMGVGGGVALGLTGPKLKTTTGETLEFVWAMETTFSRVATIGIAILLVTGPLMVWLKFAGFEGFTWWFSLKMAFVALAVFGA